VNLSGVGIDEGNEAKATKRKLAAGAALKKHVASNVRQHAIIETTSSGNQVSRIGLEYGDAQIIFFLFGAKFIDGS
jgi:hypothetical protein